MRPKKIYTLFAFVLSFSLALVFSCDDNNDTLSGYDNPTQLITGPFMFIPDTIFDYGYVPQNVTVSHKYRLCSVGDDTLKIFDVLAGRPFTDLPLEKTELPPGEYVDLEVIYETGPLYYSIYSTHMIYTNEYDPRRAPKVEWIRVKAKTYLSADSNIMHPINIIPRQVDLTDLQGDDEAAFKILNTTDDEIKIKIIDCPQEYLKIRMPFIIPPRTEQKGYISLTALGRESQFRKSITIRLNDCDTARFTIPVYRGPNVTTHHGEYYYIDFQPGQIILNDFGIH